MGWLQEIAPILVIVVGPIVGYLGVRWGRKGERENALIDQLQEERTDNRTRLDKLEAEVGELRRELVRLQSRDAQWAWHAERVEVQVTDLGGTPHPRPLALRT